MIELIVGFALGGLAFTEKGHQIGNQVFDVATKTATKMAKEVLKNDDNRTTEQND